MLAAYETVMLRYAKFRGRASRKEFWLFNLMATLILMAARAIDYAITGGSDEPGLIVTLLATLIHFLPALAVGVRRLHDIDRSGWWLLIQFVPLVGTVVLLVFSCTASSPGTNRFGFHPGLGSNAAAPSAGRGTVSRPPQTSQPRPASDTAAELRKLADLRAEGHLNEAEFQQLKSELLARTTTTPRTKPATS